MAMPFTLPPSICDFAVAMNANCQMVVNPIAGVVEGLRNCLFYDRAPDLEYTLLAAGASVVYLIGAFLLFKRLETGFADVS